jgi:hypothetical protein
MRLYPRTTVLLYARTDGWTHGRPCYYTTHERTDGRTDGRVIIQLAWTAVLLYNQDGRTPDHVCSRHLLINANLDDASGQLVVRITTGLKSQFCILVICVLETVPPSGAGGLRCRSAGIDRRSTSSFSNWRAAHCSIEKIKI